MSHQLKYWVIALTLIFSGSMPIMAGEASLLGRAHGSVGFAGTSVDSSSGVGFYFGGHFPIDKFLDLSLGYSQIDIDNGYLKTTSISGSLVFHGGGDKDVTPFASIGIGSVRGVKETYFSSSSKTVTATLASLGIQFELSDVTVLTVSGAAAFSEGDSDLAVGMNLGFWLSDEWVAELGVSTSEDTLGYTLGLSFDVE